MRIIFIGITDKICDGLLQYAKQQVCGYDVIVAIYFSLISSVNERILLVFYCFVMFCESVFLYSSFILISLANTIE